MSVVFYPLAEKPPMDGFARKGSNFSIDSRSPLTQGCAKARL